MSSKIRSLRKNPEKSQKLKKPRPEKRLVNDIYIDDRAKKYIVQAVRVTREIDA